MSGLDDSLCEEDSQQEFCHVKETPCRDSTLHSPSFLPLKDAKASSRLDKAQGGTDLLTESQELDDSLDDEQFRKLSQLQSPSFLQKKVTSDCLRNIKKQNGLLHDEEDKNCKPKQKSILDHNISNNNACDYSFSNCDVPKHSTTDADASQGSPIVPIQTFESCSALPKVSLCLLEKPSLPMENMPKVKPSFGKKIIKQSIPAGQVDDSSATGTSAEDSTKKKKANKSVVKTDTGLNEQRFKGKKPKKSANKHFEISAASKKLKPTKDVKKLAIANEIVQEKVCSKMTTPISPSSAASVIAVPCVNDPELLEMLERSSKQPGPEPNPPRKKIPKKPLFSVKKPLTKSAKASEILNEHCSEKEPCKISLFESEGKTSLEVESNSGQTFMEEQAEKLSTSSMQVSCPGTNFDDIQKQDVPPKFRRKVLTKEEREEQLQLRKQKIVEKEREKEKKRIEKEQKKKEREEMKALKKEKQEALKVLHGEKKAELEKIKRKKTLMTEKKSSACPQAVDVEDSDGEKKAEEKQKKTLMKEKKSSACPQEKNAVDVEDSDGEKKAEEKRKKMKEKKSSACPQEKNAEDSDREKKVEEKRKKILMKGKKSSVCPHEKSAADFSYSDGEKKAKLEGKQRNKFTNGKKSSAFPQVKDAADVKHSDGETEVHLAVLSPAVKDEDNTSPTNFDNGWEISLEALKDTISMRSPINRLSPSSNLDSDNDGGSASYVVCAQASSKRPLPKGVSVEEPKAKKLKTESSAEPENTTCSETSSEMESGIVVLYSPSRVSTQLSSPCSALPNERRPRVKTRIKGNMTGPVWVQCCNMWCQKWRQLKDHFDPLTVPAFWKCSDNTDAGHNDCSQPTEKWVEYENEEFQFVESAYVPGSIVWGKLDSYPWWPAMVEADPDEECYFEMGQSNSIVPVKYHVVFFSIPVSRSWLHASRVVPFTDVVDANEMHHCRLANSHKKALEDSKKEATRALEMNVKGRLEAFGFLTRHKASKRVRMPKGVAKVPKPTTQKDTQERFRQRGGKTKVTATKAEIKAVWEIRMENGKRKTTESSKSKAKGTDSEVKEVDAGMDIEERRGSVKSDEEEKEEEDMEQEEAGIDNRGDKMGIVGETKL